ncbi:uncharacterized protein ACIQIH_003370 [Cyanocitta cristata]
MRLFVQISGIPVTLFYHCAPLNQHQGGPQGDYGAAYGASGRKRLRESSRRCRALAAQIPSRRRGRRWRGRRGPGRQPRRGRAGSRRGPERASLRCASQCGSGRRGGCGDCGRSLPEPRGSSAPPGPARAGPRLCERLIQDGAGALRPPRAPPFCLLLQTPPSPPPAGPATPHRPHSPPPGPAATHLRSAFLTPPPLPPRAAPGVRNPPAQSPRPAPVAEPWRGLAAASSRPAPRPVRAGGGPGRAGGRARPAALTVRVAGGGARSARPLSARLGRARRRRRRLRRGGRAGGEGGAELGAEWKRPSSPGRARRQHVTSLPERAQEQAEGSAPPPPLRAARPPAGAGAAERAGGLCGAGEAAVGAAGRGRRGGARSRGSSCRRLRRGSAALLRPGLGVRPRSAAVPRGPLPARPLHAGRAPPARRQARGPARPRSAGQRLRAPAAGLDSGLRGGERLLGCGGSALGWTRAEGRGLRGLGSPRRGARLLAGIAGNNKDSGKQRGAVPDPRSPRRTRTALRGGRCHSRNNSTRPGGVAFCGLWKIGNNLALKHKPCLQNKIWYLAGNGISQITLKSQK